MSADTRQSTLDGEAADETRVDGRKRGQPPQRGTAEILWYADPDTDLERIGAWILRAREEGVIR